MAKKPAKPKSKVHPYQCQHCKQAPKNGDWARNYKWKTERGFNNHPCYASEVEAQQKREAKEEREKQLFQEWLKLGLTNKKIGDEVFFVAYHVTKPRYEWRGGRQVKMRYEEERSYFAGKGKVTGFSPLHGILDKQKLIEAIENKSAYLHTCDINGGGGGHISATVSSFDEAKEKAELAQAQYQKSCDEASSYR